MVAVGDCRSAKISPDTIGYIGDMATWLKLVILWLLAFALPVQGWAAAFMVHCQGNHQHPEGFAQVYETGDSHPDTRGVASDEHHAHFGTESASSDSHFDPAPVQPDPLAQHGDHGCSACGACCSAAALPSPSIDLNDTTPPDRWLVIAAVGRVGFVTSGPDRPPRLILA